MLHRAQWIQLGGHWGPCSKQSVIYRHLDWDYLLEGVVVLPDFCIPRPARGLSGKGRDVMIATKEFGLCQ